MLRRLNDKEESERETDQRKGQILALPPELWHKFHSPNSIPLNFVVEGFVINP